MAPARVGMITPSSNTVVEPCTVRLFQPLEGRVTAHFTRIRVTRISLDQGDRQQFAQEKMLEAASLLADAAMDVIVWNGTSGSWLGLEVDRRICQAIASCTGARATTSTLDLLAAARALGVRRIGLATPYLPDVHRAIEATYAGAGLEAVASACLGISVNDSFAHVPPEEIRDLIRRVAVPGAEAVAVVCTNLPAAPLVPGLEAALGRPVIDTLVATAWHTLRLAGITGPLPGLGRLGEVEL